MHLSLIENKSLVVDSKYQSSQMTDTTQWEANINTCH